MQFFPILFFFAVVALIFGSATQENSEHFMAADNNTQSVHNSIHLTKLQTTNLGRLQYRDGEVTLFQNTLKPSDFFFTPFPHVEPNLTDCSDNEFSGYTELTLVVSLYTTNLRELVEQRIKSLNDICQTKHCGVSLLPMHSIRLIHKGPQTPDFRNKFTLNSEWQSNTQLRQMIEFIIYTSNMSLCENLKKSITSRCRLSNFELQYSLHGQQTTSRTLEITTEHVTKTSMYNQIKSQFPSSGQHIVALTGNDYKNLLSETMDQVTMNLRIEEGFERMDDPVGIDQLLDRQLRLKQDQLTNVGDKLWDELYWTPELTRPDRLSKVLNKVITQDAMDSDKFRYNYFQRDEALKQDLKLHERQKVDEFEKHLAARAKETRHTTNVGTNVGSELNGSFLGIASASRKLNVGVDFSNENTNKENKLNDDVIHYKLDTERLNDTYNEGKNGTIIILQRKDAEKLLRYFSEHVEIEGDIIKPKPIDVTLVKFDKLKSVTQLVSNTVQVKTRMNVHALPLGCPYKYRHHSSATWLEESYHRLSNDLAELHKNLTTESKLIKSSISEVKSGLNPKPAENFIVGEIKLYSGDASFLPRRWVFCHGQALSRIEFQRLFSVIGESFGAGDRKTTFNVPDFRGRFPLGLSPQLGQKSGIQQGGMTHVTLSQSELPPHSHSSGSLIAHTAGDHTHNYDDPGHNHGGRTGEDFFGRGGNWGLKSGGEFRDWNKHTHTIQTDRTHISIKSAGAHHHSIDGITGSQGSGNPFSIMPPYQTIDYIIFTGDHSTK